MDTLQEHNNHYGYVIAAVCFCIQAIALGTYVSYGVFFNPLISEFGWSRAAISVAPSIAFFLMGLFGILVGRINDRIGPRIVMTVTGCLFGLGHLLMSRIVAIWQLYLFYSIIIGIGLSSVDVIALSTTARWFIRKRGIMTGIVKIGTGAGHFSIPLVASILIMSYGWRTSYSIIGVGVLVSLVAIAQLLKRDPSQISSLSDCKDHVPKSKPSTSCEGLSLGEASRTVQFWIICSVNLVIVFCTMSIILHIAPHARDIGFSATKAASVLSTIGIVSMAGRFIAGIAIDRIGSKKAMIFSFIMLIVALLWLQWAKELWMLYVFAVIYGMGHGGYFTTMSPIVAEFFGLSAHGVLFGIANFSANFGGAIGPIMAGYIFDITAHYDLAFWIFTLMSTLGLVMVLFLKPVQDK